MKDACQTEITEVQQYAYRNCLWSIDEVTNVNRPYIQRVEGVTTLLEIKSMNQLIELHCRNTFNQPLEADGKPLLPDALQTLHLGESFDHPLEVDGKPLLPRSLQTLSFGLLFNYPIEADGHPLLPDGLQAYLGFLSYLRSNLTAPWEGLSGARFPLKTHMPLTIKLVYF